jgi:transcription factor SPN1
MDFIDKDVLTESRLGRVIVFYTKCKRVSPDIARIANDLVSIWSRPIIKRSASYRDRTIETISVNRGEGNEKLNAILARGRESDKNRVRKNAVAIPTRELGSYTVAPSSSAGIMKNNRSVEFDTERRKLAAERMRRITRKAKS